MRIILGPFLIPSMPRLQSGQGGPSRVYCTISEVRGLFQNYKPKALSDSLNSFRENMGFLFYGFLRGLLGNLDYSSHKQLNDVNPACTGLWDSHALIRGYW